MSIERLIRALQAARLGLSAENLADALWLARFLPRDALSPPASLEAPDASEGQTPSEKPSPGESCHQEQPVQFSALVPPPAPVVLPSEQLAAVQGVPLRVPAASALPDPLGIGRALRPLHRRVRSRRRHVLDEAASAEQIAETSVWLPVMRPAQVRWLDLAFVVDTSTSMALWRQTVAELRDLLQFHGAFRNVRVWRLPTDSGGSELRLLAGLETEEVPLVESPPEELLDPQGQRLVMVVSDCVSRRWHTGEVPKLIESWGRVGPVVLLQVLPEQYWGRTALRNGPSVRLRASLRGSPNARLLVEEDDEVSQRQAGASPVVPVVTLEPASLATWAKLVAEGTVSAQGFELRPAQALPPPIAGTDPQLSAQARLEGFLSTASLPARKLAGLMAAVPVSLPVMNLIRETLVPEARQEHLAEVFLGGLLRELPGQTPVSEPEEKLYDFWPDVRELLLDSLPAGSARTVLLRVSDFIESRLGQTRDFRAFLVDPTRDVTPFVEQHQAFATIAAHVLQRLGGAYADLAQRLTSSLQALPSEMHGAKVPEEQVVPPHSDDWAIVIGIDDYKVPSIYFHKAEGEARAFSAWLISPEGGGLPASQVSQLLSPTSKEVEEHFRQWFRELSRRRKANHPLGKRLYLLLSGLGTEAPDQGPVLILSDHDNNDWVPYVSGLRWAEWALRSGSFQEVLLLMNCTREGHLQMPEEQRFPRLPQLPATEAPLPGNYFFGFSASLGENPYERADWPPDIFTETILDGLSGAATDDQGHVTAAALAGFVSHRMKMEVERQDKHLQTPEFQWGSATNGDFIIRKVTHLPSRVRLHFHPVYQGLSAQIRNASLEIVETISLKGKEYAELQLPRGLYLVELPQIAQSWPLEVSEPQVSRVLKWAPSDLSVLVAGSADTPGHEQLAWACDVLGETLARAGHGLLIADQPGVVRRVQRAFERIRRMKNLRIPEVIFHRDDSNVEFQRADAVVLLGDSTNTRALLERARNAGKLVIPLGRMGDFSELVQRQLQSGAHSSGDDWIPQLLDALRGSIESPEEAVSLVRKVAEAIRTFLDLRARNRWPWLRAGTGERLRQLAEEYEELRAKYPGGHERTDLLDGLVARLGQEEISLGSPSPDELASFVDRAGPGERVMLLGLLLQEHDLSYFGVVYDILVNSLSAFEQYTALRVVDRMLDQLGPEQLGTLQGTLQQLRDSNGHRFTLDFSRATQIDSILQEIRQRMIEEAVPETDPHIVVGRVDFAIITTMEDEFQAVLDRFPGKMVERQGHFYRISRVHVLDGSTAVIAVARAFEQGIEALQFVTQRILDDLDPNWILLVGIAEGVPDFEFTLGDVVLSTRGLDLTTRTEFVSHRLEGTSFLTTLPMTMMKSALQSWNTPESIGRDRPPVDWSRPETRYGDAEWTKRVVDTLEHHFGPSVLPRGPVVRIGPIFSSAARVKDMQALQRQLRQFRNVLAVDMESSGVFRAAMSGGRQQPFLSIHGISDIVGFRRDPDWTDYACHSAAAFTLALVRSGLLKRKVETASRPGDE